jgi:hypothetical protein
LGKARQTRRAKPTDEKEGISRYTRFERVVTENIGLKYRISGYQEKFRDIRKEHKKDLKDSYESRLAEKDAVIAAIKEEPARTSAVAAHDGTSTGLPTSATPIGKKEGYSQFAPKLR